MLFSGCGYFTVSNDMEVSDIAQSESMITEGPQTKDEVMLSLDNAVPASPEGISDVQLGFNLALLKKLGEMDNGNLFYSSMSVNAAMTMAYFGADGETQQEIADVLGYGDMDITEVAAYQKYLLQSYKDSGDTMFTSANSIWIDDMFDAKQGYIDTMVDVFDTEVTRLDFEESNTIDKLNSWIDRSTEGMIEKLFEKEDEPFDSTTVMVLLNAIYFNGKWTAPFNPEKTFDSQFGGSAEKSDVRMMSSSETRLGNEEENYVSVLLPYGDDKRFAMVAILPNDMDDFLQNLTTESLSSILNTFEEQSDPVVQIPVFEMEEKLKLNDVLYALGIKQAFNPDADFSRMSDEGIYIDEVLHKAKIKVDEEGAEAAAVTSVEMVWGAMPTEDRFEFIADKPFLFFIVDTENDLVLFTGKVTDLN